ncbi:helix-turn-helix transcriptional regulator [Paenibacillus pasadenensis]|uniref:helix-turn-helix transcriptional regulator n=1 Tax=Paenibacillus pasadenensis TaxID=217090 RepID=UPI000694D204|nr:helix-turn-helix transcriptional regulator [Paenibacillus pasadenensis]
MTVKAKSKAPPRSELRRLREERGPRERIADDLEISKVYLRMIETGQLTPGRDLLIRFGVYFDRPLDELFPDLFEGQVS